MFKATIAAQGLSGIFYATLEHGGVRVELTFDPHAKRSTFRAGSRREPFRPGLLEAARALVPDMIANPNAYLHT